MWPGRVQLHGLVHVVITPSPYSETAYTECGLNHRWKNSFNYADGAPTCLECWQLTLKRKT